MATELKNDIEPTRYATAEEIEIERKAIIAFYRGRPLHEVNADTFVSTLEHPLTPDDERRLHILRVQVFKECANMKMFFGSPFAWNPGKSREAVKPLFDRILAAVELDPESVRDHDIITGGESRS